MTPEMRSTTYIIKSLKTNFVYLAEFSPSYNYLEDCPIAFFLLTPLYSSIFQTNLLTQILIMFNFIILKYI